MASSTRSEGRRLCRGGWVAVALMAGIAVFILLIPFRGEDSMPPRCYSVFHYQVPCAGDALFAYDALALAAGAATAAVVGSACWLHGRRRSPAEIGGN